MSTDPSNSSADVIIIILIVACNHHFYLTINERKLMELLLTSVQLLTELQGGCAANTSSRSLPLPLGRFALRRSVCSVLTVPRSIRH